MVKNITVDMQTVESLLFFWNMIAEREKVSEIFILTVAEMEQYQEIYDEEFDNISVRKVLSALSNREFFRGDNRKEGRFWTDNLWMLEDLEYTMKMVAPIKRLNLDDLVPLINKAVPDAPYEKLEVVFVPFHTSIFTVRKNKLYINFFKALPEKNAESMESMIKGRPLKEFILDKLIELSRNPDQKYLQKNKKLRNVFY